MIRYHTSEYDTLAKTLSTMNPLAGDSNHPQVHDLQLHDRIKSTIDQRLKRKFPTFVHIIGGWNIDFAPASSQDPRIMKHRKAQRLLL